MWSLHGTESWPITDLAAVVNHQALVHLLPLGRISLAQAWEATLLLSLGLFGRHHEYKIRMFTSP